MMKIDRNIIVREIAGEYILIPTGDTALKMTGIFAVTEVAAQIWKKLADDKDEQTVIAELLSEYDVEESVLRSDYADFIEKLTEIGLVEI